MTRDKRLTLPRIITDSIAWAIMITTWIVAAIIIIMFLLNVITMVALYPI